MSETDATIRTTLETAVAHHQAGRLDAAAALYRHILDARPDHADALHLSGVILLQRGDTDAAIALIERAVAAAPGLVLAWHNLGLAHETCGRLRDAAVAYRRAIALAPANAPLHLGLGNALAGTGELEAAAAAFRQAAALDPTLAAAPFNLGNVLARAGRHDDAIAAYDEAIRRDPDHHAARFNRANAARELGRLAAAIADYRAIIARAPGFADAHNNLGLALAALGRRAEAIEANRRALATGDASAPTRVNLAMTLAETGALAEALEHAREAVRLDPGSGEAAAVLAALLQDGCVWAETDAAAARLDRLVDAAIGAGRMPPESPILSVRLDRPPARRLAVARAWSAAIARAAGAPEPRRWTPASDGRIRLGYLSHDFFDHPIAHLAAALLEDHARAAFAVTAFGYGPDDASPWRRRIVAGADRFVDLRDHDHRAGAAAIAASGIDILIDLTGPTRGGRMAIAALRPAPVQVWYLGFPGTTGADFFDYVISDAIVTPDADRAHHAERVVRLPCCYQANDARAAVAPIPARSAENLPDAGVVFASFSQPFKIEPVMFAAWMRILARVPDSVLWLLAANPVADDALRHAAAAHGVAPARLVFAPRVPKDRHLARHALADLVLDTRLYNGHTGTSDSLRAGVPVVTLRGDHPEARVAASILAAAGLDALITTTLSGYEALAVRLATDRGALAAFRARIADPTRLPLFDTARFARTIERAYSRMWARHRAGLAPAEFDVPESG